MPIGDQDLNQGSLPLSLFKQLEERVDTLSHALEEVRTLVLDLVSNEPSRADQKNGASFHDDSEARRLVDGRSAEPVAESAPTLPRVDAGWGSLNLREAAEIPPTEDQPPADRLQAWRPEEPKPGNADDGDLRDEVRRTVEMMRSELGGAGASPAAADVSDQRQANGGMETASVEEAVSMAHEDAHAEEATEQASAPADEEDPREAVRRAVEEARAELAAGRLQPETITMASAPGHGPQDSEDADAEAAREEVRRAVAEARAALNAGTLTMESAPSRGRPESEEPEETDEPDPGNADAARENVQRAVAQMRAAMAAGASLDAGSDAEEDQSDDEPMQSRIREETFTPPPAIKAYEQRREERVAYPPSIVIEDPEGRVELVRVYDTLSRVQCSGHAVLLNYTPHSVTVGLGTVDIPAKEALADAVKASFGRPCSVVTEGYRLSVTMDSDKAA